MAYTKWELTPKERAFVAHCEKQGYQIIVCKQYAGKSKWQIDPNHEAVPVFNWEIQNDTKEFNWQYFENALKIKVELEELRELRKGLMK